MYRVNLRHEYLLDKSLRSLSSNIHDLQFLQSNTPDVRTDWSYFLQYVQVLNFKARCLYSSGLSAETGEMGCSLKVGL